MANEMVKLADVINALDGNDELINIIKTLDVTDISQIMWERDMAIEQLNELGYGFGQKCGWVPFSDDTPDDGQLVWATIGAETQVCQYLEENGGEWYLQDGSGIYMDSVEAWMEMPQPYEGNIDDEE